MQIFHFFLPDIFVFRRRSRKIVTPRDVTLCHVTSRQVRSPEITSFFFQKLLIPHRQNVIHILPIGHQRFWKKNIREFDLSNIIIQAITHFFFDFSYTIDGLDYHIIVLHNFF